MTRMKKTRTGGALGMAKKPKEGGSINTTGSKRAGKGKPAGSRQQSRHEADQNSVHQQQDKRLGSKKAIDLSATVATTRSPQTATTKPQPSWPPTTVAAQQRALQLLEQDDSFMAQLEILEQGGVLAGRDQADFEQKLERYDWLLEQLGIEDDDDADEEPWDNLSSQGKSLKDEWL